MKNIVVGGAILVALLTPIRAVTAQSTCTSQTVLETLTLDYALYMAADTQSLGYATRGKIGMRGVDSSAVTVVRNDSTCAAIAQSLKAQLPLAEQADFTTPGVVKIGSTRYLAYNGLASGGGRSLYALFDASFNFLFYITR